MALWGGRFTQAADKRLKILMIHYGLITVWQNRIFKARLVGPKPW